MCVLRSNGCRRHGKPPRPGQQGPHGQVWRSCCCSTRIPKRWSRCSTRCAHEAGLVTTRATGGAWLPGGSVCMRCLGGTGGWFATHCQSCLTCFYHRLHRASECRSVHRRHTGSPFMMMMMFMGMVYVVLTMQQRNLAEVPTPQRMGSKGAEPGVCAFTFVCIVAIQLDSPSSCVRAQTVSVCATAAGRRQGGCIRRG